MLPEQNYVSSRSVRSVPTHRTCHVRHGCFRHRLVPVISLIISTDVQDYTPELKTESTAEQIEEQQFGGDIISTKTKVVWS